jgi:hypothetical protein
VVVDTAGAMMGGALRFLRELDGYLNSHPAAVTEIGRGHRLSVPWLARRELLARDTGHAIALNNVTFVYAGRFRTVLLRNALHFLSEDERAEIPLSPAFRAQTSVVLALLRRADRVVVPSTAMGDRVTRAIPGLASRMSVMYHPVTPPAKPSTAPQAVALCPVLDAPYKKMGSRLIDVIAAVGDVRRDPAHGDLRLLLTATATEVSALQLPRPPWVELLGRLTPGELATAQGAARVIIYPTVLESFGFPLAEARLARQPVVAPDSSHAREIAGDALVGFDPTRRPTLADALRRAMSTRLGPLDENPFDRDRYFDRLFTVS